MEDNNKPKRRLILPEKRTQALLKINPMDISVDTVLSDAMNCIAIEVATFRVKVGNGKGLEPKEARMLTGYVESLIKLKRELRETERESDINKLSNEELVLLARKVLTEGTSVIEGQGTEVLDDEETD